MTPLRFAANLSFLFGEHEFLARFAAAAAAGFRAAEFHFPYAWPAETLRATQEAAGVSTVLFNLPAGDWAAGDRGIACLPARREEFRAGVEQALAYADALGVSHINCLAGRPEADLPREIALDTLRNNLSWAAPRLAAAGIELLLEPLNTRDNPGFLIATSRAARELIAQVGAPNLKLQYDVYHAQVMEENIARTLTEALPLIGHIQLADNPGRHEPGSGEINFPFLFRHLEALGYSGWIGCEYVPQADTEAGLAWLRAL